MTIKTTPKKEPTSFDRAMTLAIFAWASVFMVTLAFIV